MVNLFPTQVGVFLLIFLKSLLLSTFPHASGSVPYGTDMDDACIDFFPHKWECPVGTFL